MSLINNLNENIYKYQEYLKKEKNYSSHTILAYEKDVRSFFYYLENRTEDSLSFSEIDYSFFRAWMSSLSEEGLQNRTINRKMSSLKSFFKFLYQVKMISAFPLAGHKSLKNSRKIQVPFSVQEMDLLTKQFSFEKCYVSRRDRLIVDFFYCLGIRRSELISLQISQIDLQDKLITIEGKGSKERKLPLLSDLKYSIEQYLEEYRKKFESIDGYFFLLENGKKMNETFVYRLINGYFRGVSSKQKKSPHMLRHTFATHLYNNGADLNSIKELMGHSSLSSTQIYMHSSLKALKEVYSKAHPRKNEEDK